MAAISQLLPGGLMLTVRNWVDLKLKDNLVNLQV